MTRKITLRRRNSDGNYRKSERITPWDENGYLSTSPWPNNADAQLSNHTSVANRRLFYFTTSLPEKSRVFSDVEFNYHNKVEFSWFGDKTDDDEKETLDLAFFKRGGKGKVIVDGTSLAHPSINKLAIKIRDLLRTKPIVLILLIRLDQQGNAVWQLYVKDKIENLISLASQIIISKSGEIAYSIPQKPSQQNHRTLEQIRRRR